MLSFSLDFNVLKRWIDKQPGLMDKACLKALYEVANQIQKDTRKKSPKTR
jgi:hypothetical protein